MVVKVFLAAGNAQLSTLLVPYGFCILVFRMAIQALFVFDAIFQVVFLDTWHQNNSSFMNGTGRR
jgi:hypothetical protein